MRRSLVGSVLVSAVLALMLAMAPAASAAGDDFAGVWTTPDLADFRDITYTFEPLGAGVYSLRVDIEHATPCGDGLEVLVDTAAVVAAGVLNFDLVVTSCANDGVAEGTVFPDRTATPQPDGTLLLHVPTLGDLTFTRTTTQFFDVLVGQFFTDAVAWLACENITTGTSSTTFSPGDSVSRGQMAAFLWRFDGRPDPTSLDTSFIDVPAGMFFSVAVAWLAEEGITTGTSATTFSPADAVTRGQMAAFLWRFSGSPQPASLDTPFTDVAAGKFFSVAVAWLVERGITTGTSATTFSPDDPVTRGQMAAFLWRLAGEPAV